KRDIKKTITDPATGTSRTIISTYQLEVKNGIVRVASFTGPGWSACGSDTGSDYVTNDRQQITRVTDANGHITTSIYDLAGNRTSMTEGQQLNDLGEIEPTPETRTTDWTYIAGTDRVETITRASVANLGQQAVTTFAYYPDDPAEGDNRNNLHTRTETGFADTETPISRTTTYTYTGYGRVETIDGPRTDLQDITTFTYYPNDPGEGNNRGQLHTVVNGLGHVTTYGNYNAFGKPELITPPYGEPTVLDYDDYNGRLLSRTSGTIVTSYEYYDDGRLHKLHLPDTRTITYSYTPSGKPWTITDTLGNKITYTYDDQNQRTKMEIHDPENELQHFVEYTYEDTGDLDRTIQADGTYEDLNYDPVGNLIARINALGKTTEQYYDALNRLTSMVAPVNDTETATTGYHYNGNDNLTTVTDAEGKATAYTYDDFGRKISQTSPDTGLTTYQYDPADNLISSTDANNVTTTYGYDALNRLTGVQYSDPARNVSYGYDENGFIGLLTSMHDSSGSTTYQYDVYGRLTGETRNQGGRLLSLGYGYNDNNELHTITYPSGRVITYGRDTAGRIKTVTSTFQGSTEPLASEITYKPFGPREDVPLGNSINVDATLNQLYRLTGVSAGALYQRSYTYYPTGHVETITDAIDPSASQAFTYDDLGRLDTAQGKYGSYDWDYDKAGNRRTETHDTVLTNYAYEPGSNRLDQVTAGQTVTDYNLDPAGNLLSKGDAGFTWDQNNRLLAASTNGVQAGAYDYDGRGLRTTRTVNGETLHSVYDQSGNLLAELDDQGFVLREFVYLEGDRLALYDRPAYQTFTVTVTQADGTPLAGANVYPHMEDGTALDFSIATNAQGIATFDQANFEPGNYVFLVSYLDEQAWSPPVYVHYSAGIQARLDIAVQPVQVSVVLAGIARAGAVVTVYSADGVYLGMQRVTDGTGKVTFSLPQGRTYKFKVLYKGAFYWSASFTVGSTGGALTVTEANPAGRHLHGSILHLLLGRSGDIPATSLPDGSFGATVGSSAEAWDMLSADDATFTATGQPSEYLRPGDPGGPESDKTMTDSANALFDLVVSYGIYYYISDHLGTAQLLTDSQGAVVWQGNYTPFGEVDVVVNTVANYFRFPGQYFDAETGLHYNWHRYYDPTSGRYLSADPIGLDGGMNLYLYTGANPVNAIDPMGLYSSSDVIPAWNNYCSGSKTPWTTSFSSINWGGIESQIKKQLSGMVGSGQCQATTKQVSFNVSAQTGGADSLIIGRHNVTVSGQLNINCDCTWTFSGQMSSATGYDPYNFNPSNRGPLGEFSTWVGGERCANGATFNINITGSQSITLSGP
ncbi:MAG: RHS repeat-associated core domain-containing protein, partial [Thermodesulfobacteriota bacterium]